MIRKVFVDTETSSLSSYKGQILELAALMEVDGEEFDRFHSLIKPMPGVEITPEALEINKLTLKDLNDAPTMKEVHAKFTAFLGKQIDKYNKKDKAFLLGYNIKFDADFLRSMFMKCGDKYFGSWFWAPYIDIMSLAGEVLMERRMSMEDFKLTTVYKEIFKIDFANAHSAMDDITATRLIYQKVIGAFKLNIKEA